MSRCLRGTNGQARIGRVARSIRVHFPMAGVDEVPPDRSGDGSWTLEVTLYESDSLPARCYNKLLDEDLDIELAQPRGPHFDVVATA